jgi:hypothetical protein
MEGDVKVKGRKEGEREGEEGRRGGKGREKERRKGDEGRGEESVQETE